MTDILLTATGACLAGFLLDFLFGDPVRLYHPVRIIGNGIALGERLRSGSIIRCGSSETGSRSGNACSGNGADRINAG